MKTKYLVSRQNIPEDGSYEIIDNLALNLRASPADQLLVFPDVHYKRGSNVTNGLLTASDTYIYPSMLGVANCGYTWGIIRCERCVTNAEIAGIFEQLASTMHEHTLPTRISEKELWLEFKAELKRSWDNGSDAQIFKFLQIKSFESLLKTFGKFFPREVFKSATKSLGTLGGGNHFMEAHEIIENYSSNFEAGDKVFILHSDSVSVGSKVYLLFSNLADLNSISGRRRYLVKLVNRYRQFKYFLKHAELSLAYVRDVYCLLFNPDPMRAISYKSRLGKLLLINFYFCSIFGEMNRRRIVLSLENKHESGTKLQVEIHGSDSHDSISLEEKDQKLELVQRNGVQKLKDNDFFVLPGALGTYSYIMKGTSSKENYRSVNHGVGRIHDKHIARELFETPQDNSQFPTLPVFRLSNVSLSEQHPKSFKSVDDIITEMARYELAEKGALLKPICSIKA